MQNWTIWKKLPPWKIWIRPVAVDLATLLAVIYVWHSQSPFWLKVKTPEILPNWILCFGTLFGIAIALGTLKAIRIQTNAMTTQTLAVTKQTEAVTKQTEAALIAATAARDSVTVAINSERAWVIDEIRQIRELEANSSLPFRAHITLKNWGGVPALVTSLRIRFHTVSLPEQEYPTEEPLPAIPAYDLDKIFFELGANGLVLAPNQSVTVAEDFEAPKGLLNLTKRNQIERRMVLLYCYGRIEYHDGLSKQRFAQFCYLWDPNYDPTGVIQKFRRIGPEGYNAAN